MVNSRDDLPASIRLGLPSVDGTCETSCRLGRVSKILAAKRKCNIQRAIRGEG